jgi:hypothetical protein
MTTSKQPFLFKFIFWTSIFFIGFWILLPILELFIPLEFTDNEIKNSFYNIRFWGLPLSIMLTLTGTLKPNDSSIGSKVILTLLISGISVFIMIISLFGDMCGWTATGKVFFEDKKDHSIKIVERDYGCGALDSGLPKYKVVKIKELTKYLVLVTEIDTNKIDKSEWIRVPNEKE